MKDTPHLSIYCSRRYEPCTLQPSTYISVSAFFSSKLCNSSVSYCNSQLTGPEVLLFNLPHIIFLRKFSDKTDNYCWLKNRTWSSGVPLKSNRDTFYLGLSTKFSCTVRFNFKELRSYNAGLLGNQSGYLVMNSSGTTHMYVIRTKYHMLAISLWRYLLLT